MEKTLPVRCSDRVLLAVFELLFLSNFNNIFMCFFLQDDMPKHVTLLMEKNPDDRTERDLELIGREVWKIPSFRKYSARLQRMMCRIVRYMRYGDKTIANVAECSHWCDRTLNKAVVQNAHQIVIIKCVLVGSVAECSTK